MNTIQLTIEIDKPVEDVWNLFHDETKMPEWLIGFDSIKQIEGEDRKVGSKYKLFFDENGKTIEMEETVTAYEPNRLYANSMKTDVMDTITTMNFTPSATGTKLVVESTFTGIGVVANLMLRMGLSYIENRYKQSYQKFKELAESL
jgi:uncharacterized protein YndB with AHSA1/START domain